MSYVALYRKFRPRTFEQVKGQDHIVRTLKNQIRNQRVGHAYLFTGTRGTGKTSVAKILARAVNCLDPKDGEPCCECENCIAAAQGNFLDLVEIDAASNTGVEDIRRVIEEIRYTPARGKYKVYIIDEVHMLSVNAFNAFLKTLEEPPEYVIFILATTEPHKLPATILSRCQRYDFKRISLDVIADNMKELLAKEQIQAEEKALRYVARVGDGSMRDALSLLDRCVAFSTDGTITYENVLSILGTVDIEAYSALFRAIHAFDVAGALRIVEQTVDAGKDLTPFVNDFMVYLRNMLIFCLSGKNAAEMLGLSEENLALLSADAAAADVNALMRWIRILAELLNQLRFSSSKQILVEVAIVKLARPQMESNSDTILERLRMLEQKAEAGGLAPVQPVARSIPAAPPVHTEQMTMDLGEEVAPEQEPEPVVPSDPAPVESPQPSAPEAVQGDGDAARIVSCWPQILARCTNRRIRSTLNKAQAVAEESGVALYVTGEIAYKQINEAAVLSQLHSWIEEVCGVKAVLTVRHAQEKPEIENQQDLSSLLQNINMTVEMEEI